MEEKKQDKLPYEELERVAMQLNGQVQKLYDELQKERERNFIGRAQVLTECISLRDKFEDKSFVARCENELKGLVYPESGDKPAEK